MHGLSLEYTNTHSAHCYYYIAQVIIRIDKHLECTLARLIHVNKVILTNSVAHDVE